MNELTTLTVNLIPDAMTALGDAAARDGNTRTDTVNRALQMYEFITNQMADGWELALHRNGEIRVYKAE